MMRSNFHRSISASASSVGCVWTKRFSKKKLWFVTSDVDIRSSGLSAKVSCVVERVAEHVRELHTPLPVGSVQHREEDRAAAVDPEPVVRAVRRILRRHVRVGEAELPDIAVRGDDVPAKVHQRAAQKDNQADDDLVVDVGVTVGETGGADQRRRECMYSTAATSWWKKPIASRWSILPWLTTNQ